MGVCGSRGWGERKEIRGPTLVGVPSFNSSIAENENGENVRTFAGVRKGHVSKFSPEQGLSAGEGMQGVEVFPEGMA